MDNENLEYALCDLVDAIRGFTLGSVESVVIDDAGKALINNWNDHNKDNQIAVEDELNNWKNLDDKVNLNCRPSPPCACGQLSLNLCVRTT